MIKRPETVQNLISENLAQAAEIRRLEHQNELLKKTLFGQKSDRILSDSDETGQTDLFGDILSALTEDGPTQNEIPANVEKDSEGKKGRRPLPDDLARVEKVIDLTDEEKKCPICGDEMVKFGEDRTEKLKYQAALLFVFAMIRPKYACPKHPEAGVAQAELPPQLIEKGIADSSLVAWIIYAKYFLHLPLHRQEKLFTHYGCNIKRQRFCDWEQHAAQKLQPVIDAMRREIDSSGYVQMDETTLKVRKKESDGKLATGWLWPRSDGRQVLFEFDPSRSGKAATKFLKDFKGYLQTDGFVSYGPVAARPDITQLACLAHARRKFVDAARCDKKFCTTVVDMIRELYQIEKSARKLWEEIDQAVQKEKETEDEILRKKWACRFQLRVSEKAPAKLNTLFDLLETERYRYTPKDPVRKAIDYTLNLKEKLLTYLYDGRLEIDNNKIENRIRPITLGRNNWLFAASRRGAEKIAVMATLTGSAAMLGLEPYEYLNWLLNKLPLASTPEEFEPLTPLAYSRQAILKKI